MKPRRHFRVPLAIVLIAGLLATWIGTVIASMSPGSIQGQEGWSGGPLPIAASVDQSVDHTGLNQHTGTGAWRISNKSYNGNFQGWPSGPGLAVSAGQPSSGAGADQFIATLWFRSASASADGSNIEIDLGTVPGDDRNTFLALTNRADADGGLQLRAGEPDGATGLFRPTQIIATGISRGVYHRLDIVANFQEGSANDTVAYALDGVALANPLGGMTFGTFEGYREGIVSPYALSNRLFFRSGAAPSAYGAFVDADVQGFYFDDLFYAVAKQSAPAIRLAGYATGFEPGFFTGSIQDQEGWTGGTISGVTTPIAASVDQAVDLTGVNQRTGTGAWRISNNTSLGNYNGNYPGWPFSPPLPVSAGQPSALAGADQFTATLWFRSASGSADGSYIEIDLGNVVGNDRTTFLALTNDADAEGGLQLRANEPDGATGDFLPLVIVAQGISRGIWHRLDIVANFIDGPTNDTVAYALDGVRLANTGGGLTFRTFEGYHEGIGSAYQLSNRLFFRSSRPPSGEGAFPDAAAQGFYFDDLFYAVAKQSLPAVSLAGYATGFEPALPPAQDLTLSKSHVGNFTQGQIGAQFTIAVTNIGPFSTSGEVTLADVVPLGLTPTAASGAGWACTVTGTTVTCTRSDALAPGASYPLTITVNVAANASASVANTATISGGGDVNTANNTATDATTILPGSDLILSKSHVADFTQGQAGATYTFSVTNAGAGPTIGSVSVVDTVPAGLTPTAAIGTGWTCGVSGATVTCTRSDALAPLASYAPVTLTVDVAPDAPASVTNTATISGGGDVNATNNAAADVTTILPPAPSSLSLYFAEGATGFFTTSIDLVNPSASETATATMTFVGDSGPVGTKAITLAPGASQAISLNDAIPTEGAFGTIVESNVELAGERHMSWGEGGYGSSLERGVRQAATTWYFAEGATNGFDLYYLLLNPGTTAADVTIQFLLDDGPPLTKTVTVAPRSRTTQRVLDFPDPELQAAGFGAVLTSTVPIVAEQAMYSSSPTQFFGAGSASAATPALATTVHFAEGATGFFDEFLALINPSPSAAATATILYRLPDGTTLSKAYPIAPERRLTVWLNQEARTDPALAGLASTAVAVTVTSDQPIAVTRKMYWPSPLEPGGWGESSDVGGITTTTLKAYVAKATVGGADEAATYLLIANTSADAGQIQVTATPAGGTPVVQTYPIPGNARLTVDLAWFGFVDQPFSVAVESLASPLAVPVVVEVASYTSPGGQFWAAGSASAASVPATTPPVDGAPTFASASSTAFTVGGPGTFTVTTAAAPTAAISVTGALPAGVTFVDNGNGTGTLSGTPAAGSGGVYPLTFTAVNSVSSATQSFTLTVNEAPVTREPL